MRLDYVDQDCLRVLSSIDTTRIFQVFDVDVVDGVYILRFIIDTGTEFVLKFKEARDAWNAESEFRSVISKREVALK